MSVILSTLAVICILAGCNNRISERNVDELPDIYPDYTDLTIPFNIAPLNFFVRDNPSKTEVLLSCNRFSLRIAGGDEVKIPLRGWKRLLEEAKGSSVTVEVKARFANEWRAYKPFLLHVSEHSIDPFMTYRLIEPGYEVWNHIRLAERSLESFSERTLADNNLSGRACMNCHIPSNQDPALSFFHVRGPQGGTVLNRGGVLWKSDIRDGDTNSTPTYGSLHPDGRYGVFSINSVIPAFHTLPPTMLEVYDRWSSLVIIDFEEEKIVAGGPVGDSASSLETFPAFSADGNSVYFCTAAKTLLPDSIRSLRYVLCRVGFNSATGGFSNRVDTLLDLRREGLSISFPRLSPSGRFLLYCVSRYGTFPIWHRETDLQMFDLQIGSRIDFSRANSDGSETWHSWSSNSCWIVFASKRDDGIYGKPYICFVDSTGRAGKPFVLPQRNPRFYDQTLKSFNLPELMRGRATFSAADVERVLRP
ncbi:MAG: hypothetical protein LBC81_05370 [Tannerellaceae bacterium]|nr:hypothetical protein [Tannerellaceae bacterium]